MRALIISCCFSIIAISNISAQLLVDNSPTIEAITQMLKRQGISIQSIQIDCEEGSFGTFSGNSNIPLTDGILLTTGNANEAIGPNNSAVVTGSNTGSVGDSDLDALPGVNSTVDACAINLTIDSGCADEITFKYIFASEEYFQTVSSIGDAFAIFISGAGIMGTQNIALVPGTTQGISVLNINDVTNTAYFIDNGDGESPPQNNDDTVVQYDGFTTELTATQALQNNQTYQIKLVIADDVDGGLDSGVFIENGGVVDLVSFDKDNVDANGHLQMVEGCVNGKVILNFSETLVSDTDLSFTISGTATNGTDFIDLATNTNLLNDYTIPAGSNNFQIDLIAFEDGNAEGTESLIIAINDTCGIPIDSLIIDLNDGLAVEALPMDTVICNNNPVELSVTGGDIFSWQPTNGLSCTDCPNPIANPNEATTYVVTGSSGQCTNTDTVFVEVFNSAANAGEDQVICDSTDVVTIGPDNTVSSLSYSWTDQTGSVISNNANLAVGLTDFPNNNSQNIYTLTVSSTNGCSQTDDVLVRFAGLPNILANAESDTIYKGERVLLNAAGAGPNGSYEWQPATDVVLPNSQSTFALPVETQEFIVTGTTENGCINSDTIKIIVEPKPTIIFPTAFSPNNDGQNDIFIPSYSLIESLIEFSVFNRWGQQIYTTSGDFSNGWDGTQNGKKQPVGVYSYYLIAKEFDSDKEILKRGNVTLIR